MSWSSLVPHKQATPTLLPGLTAGSSRGVKERSRAESDGTPTNSIQLQKFNTATMNDDHEDPDFGEEDGAIVGGEEINVAGEEGTFTKSIHFPVVLS